MVILLVFSIICSFILPERDGIESLGIEEISINNQMFPAGVTATFPGMFVSLHGYFEDRTMVASGRP